MIRKRYTSAVLAFIMLAMLISGCKQSSGYNRSGGKISIVCSVFPQYDWVRQILNGSPGNIELTLLVGNGVDMHNYLPSVADIVKISNCDLFIYVGGESDKWVKNALAEAMNQEMVTMSLLDILGADAKAEEIVEGMEDDSSGEAHDEVHSGIDGERDYDEHVWLSLKNAELFCSAIAEALAALDTANADLYRSNLELYTRQLQDLDMRYQAAVDAGTVKTLLFCDRFPFRYLTEDYGLSYYAAFPGCSAESEASFNTIIFLAGRTDELKLRSVLVTESADQSIARTVRDNTDAKDQQILVLNSMQSITLTDVENGVTYLSVMESNLETLKEALG